ncbi:unnamed protein product [Clonostachys byssicola]|uniref:Invertebrate defensins family profile domain-containing protein n=1 Tax=Clonostachys byssicola TaxID=160290 RepID=A0A9N9U994_9HYPO|nr:unnamed protein product [Clonostachys byssicola]
MHFTKTIITLIGLSGLAATYDANDNNGLAQRELSEVYDDFLVARDEYIEKRELYLRAKTAAKSASKSKSSPKPVVIKGKMLPPGICKEPLTAMGFYCCRRGGRQEQCGPMCSNPGGHCACEY